jgi:hypothetical protein
MLISVVTGLVTLILLLVAWLAVQQAWRRAFPEGSVDPDPLAGRMGCRGSCGGGVCPRRSPDGTCAAQEEDT